MVIPMVSPRLSMTASWRSLYVSMPSLSVILTVTVLPLTDTSDTVKVSENPSVLMESLVRFSGRVIPSGMVNVAVNEELMSESLMPE